MAERRCPFCGAAISGRSDKRYCSSTCRRDACRVRERPIRLGGYEVFGREVSLTKMEEILVARLKREYGENHRVVREAERRVKLLRRAELERMHQALKDLAW